jgi:hypothetical protein
MFGGAVVEFFPAGAVRGIRRHVRIGERPIPGRNGSKTSSSAHRSAQKPKLMARLWRIGLIANYRFDHNKRYRCDSHA